MSTVQPELPTPKRSNKAFYIIFIVLLIGANIYLYLNNRNTSSTLENVSTEKEKLDSTYKQLTHDYKKTLAELEEYRGKLAGADSQINVFKFALDNRKKEIQSILMKTNLDKNDLARARVLIEELKHEKDRMVLQFDSLKQAYQVLNEKFDTVSTHLSQTQTRVKGLESENKNLANVAKVLHISAVSVKGEKDKGKGQEKETNSVRHIDFLRLGFSVEKNAVADAGSKTIYYRISTPENKLLYNASKGGGIMTSKDDGSEIRYTGKIEFDYNNQKMPLNTKWVPDTKLQKGDYQIEFYSEGYSIGAAKFTLNNSLF